MNYETHNEKNLAAYATQSEKDLIAEATYPNVYRAQVACGQAIVQAATAYNRATDCEKHTIAGRLDEAIASTIESEKAAQAAQAAATDALRFGQAQDRIDGPEARVAARIADAIVRRANVAAAKAKDSATNAIAQAARAGRKGW